MHHLVGAKNDSNESEKKVQEDLNLNMKIDGLISERLEELQNLNETIKLDMESDTMKRLNEFINKCDDLIDKILDNANLNDMVKTVEKALAVNTLKEKLRQTSLNIEMMPKVKFPIHTIVK